MRSYVPVTEQFYFSQECIWARYLGERCYFVLPCPCVCASFFLSFLVWCVWWLCTPWISFFISRRLWEDVFPWLLVIMFLGVIGRTWKPCAGQIKTNKEMMGAPLSLHWPGGEEQGKRRRSREGGVGASWLPLWFVKNALPPKSNGKLQSGSKTYWGE